MQSCASSLRGRQVDKMEVRVLAAVPGDRNNAFLKMGQSIYKGIGKKLQVDYLQCSCVSPPFRKGQRVSDSDKRMSKK
jgi:hypothetical protein